jgi:hypothetical protein
MEQLERPRLTHVAIRKSGIVYSLPSPNRHHHILWIFAKRKGLPNVPSVDDESLLVERVEDGEDSQGFLDANGRYLNREQAEVNAFLHNQVKNGELIGGPLTSEDLW